jgi:peptidyl-prolyl cis-trans isomerase C
MARALALALLVAQAAHGQTAAPAPAADPDVLLRRGNVVVTRGDYDAELFTRVPEDARVEFSTSASRVDSLLGSLLIQKRLAAQARDAGIDRDPAAQRRIADETEKFLAALMIARIEEEAKREFDALPNKEGLVRERYLVGKDRLRTPDQVAVTHILIDARRRSRDEALQRAVEVRARIAAGENMEALAKALSDDPSAQSNAGRLEYFGRDRMDPAFSKAAFALTNVGDLSEPVVSRAGVHIIRLDGRKEGAIPPLEQAQATLLAEMRRAYVDRKRAERVDALKTDPQIYINHDAVNALVVRQGPDLSKKAPEGATAAPPK